MGSVLPESQRSQYPRGLRGTSKQILTFHLATEERLGALLVENALLPLPSDGVCAESQGQGPGAPAQAALRLE